MVRFVLIVSVLLSVMVAPDRLGANVMTAPLAALVMADRSVPGPLSALLVTTCAEAIASAANRPTAIRAVFMRLNECLSNVHFLSVDEAANGLNRRDAKTNAANETNKRPTDGSGTIVSTHLPGLADTDPSPTMVPNTSKMPESTTLPESF